MDNDFITKFKDYTSKQMDAGASPRTSIQTCS